MRSATHRASSPSAAALAISPALSADATTRGEAARPAPVWPCGGAAVQQCSAAMQQCSAAVQQWSGAAVQQCSGDAQSTAHSIRVLLLTIPLLPTPRSPLAHHEICSVLASSPLPLTPPVLHTAHCTPAHCTLHTAHPLSLLHR